MVVPGIIDYTEAADQAFARFAAAGINLVRSDQPISSWPGIAQASYAQVDAARPEATVLSKTNLQWLIN